MNILRFSDIQKYARAKSQEPRAKSQEPRAKSQEPRAKSQEHYDVPLDFVKSPILLVAVPTYNEAENIELFLKTVFEYIPPTAEILVVDDSSPDGTAKIVEQLARDYPARLRLIKRPGKQGGATAFLQAFSWGIKHGFDGILAMDADFSHNPEYIPQFLTAAHNYDVVIGSRLVHGGRIENRSFTRDLLSCGASFYCRVLLGDSIKDWTGGYNLWSKKALEIIGTDSIVTRGYSFQLEMKYKALSRGCSITEIPIVFPERKKGISKMPPSFLVKALADVWLIKFISMPPVLKQFIKFAITGGLGTITNLCIFFVCADIFSLPEIPVSVFCFLAAGTQNYTINHKWSFAKNMAHEKLSLKTWAIFIAASLIGLSVNLIVLKFVLFYFVLPFKFIAQGCGIAAGMTMNFVMSKLIVFRRKKK